MKKYLLLRNNKQTGPYTYEELMEIGLRSQDLLWIEGKSASWRYPAEFDEFKILPSILKELPADHTFTNIQNDIFVFSQDMARPMEPLPEDELSEFPTLALFMDPEVHHRQILQREISNKVPPPPVVPKPEVPRKIRMIFEGKPISADENDVPLISPEIPVVSRGNITVEKQEKFYEETVKPEIKLAQTQPVISSRIFVTLPATASDNTFMAGKRREIELKQREELTKEISIPAEAQFPVKSEQAPLQPVIELTQPVFKPEVVNIVSPVEKAATVLSGKAPGILQSNDSSFHFPGRSSAETTSNLMQKLAVAAAIISLLAVGGLIANAILNPDAYNYGIDKKAAPRVAVSSEQLPAGNVSEKNETDINQQPLNSAIDKPLEGNAPVLITPVKKSQAPLKKDNQAEQTSSQFPPVIETVSAETGTDISQQKEPEPDPKEETRRNINSLVSYKLNNFKVNAFGGVSDFEVTINNGSSYPLDLVVVELKYIQSNKKVFKTERLEFRSVAPNGKQTLAVAKSNRGIKVVTAITNISSRDLDLSYNN